ncbi:late expression factor-10 [Maruca vitrata nucleopolyhedrovirus]|uniref:Late expression factor-10 n=1 Tax=Maruca vitrata nucleopolyhedrovirus TaxID=1307954 RepID=A1YRA1_9ABAC|nr:late expression factor-10 [Maruca vitrata nucleopolyhedrovirus]ABL75991.1 late expression factor-10 [Maruca vitrata nucleopolyhedrovirus]
MTNVLFASDVDLINCILKDNLFLIDNNYIILNVFDQEKDQIRSMCLGEIDTFQTDATAEANAMLDTSSTSELQSNAST